MKHLFLTIALLLSFTVSPTDAHTYPSRKKVGLVLSGGGAKGMAHIGAIKVIEEAGIPIESYTSCMIRFPSSLAVI